MLKSIIYNPDGVHGFHYINDKTNKEFFISSEESLKNYQDLNVRYNGRVWYCTDCDINSIMKYSVSEFFEIDKNGVVLGLTKFGEKFISMGCDLILPESINGIKVVELGESCFEGTDFSHIVLPNNLIKINKSAFAYSSISSIIIPDSCIEIGEMAFMECYDLEELIIGKNIKKIDLGAFYDCRGLDESKIFIPNSVEKIGEDSFGCIEDADFIVDNKRGAILMISSGYADYEFEEDNEDYDEEVEGNEEFENDFEDEYFFGACNVNVKYLR